MKNNKKSGIQYYGSLRGAKQYFKVGGCDSESNYDIFHLGAGYGVEKIKIKRPHTNAFGKTTFKGIRGNLGLSSGQETSTRTKSKYGGPFVVTNRGATYTCLLYTSPSPRD